MPAPVPTQSNLPRVTKSPTDETVPVNGKCQFVAKYENAKWAEWHFVSPDGTRDLNYSQAEKEFKTLKIINGYAKDMTLENIPEALNGWKVYCRFSNDSGAVNTEKAKINVTANTAGSLPKITKNPTDETVQAGGSAWFVAKYENAIWAVWHFVSPDGTRDLTYSDAQTQFPNLQIIGGDQSTLQLKNIPAELSGWRVYCEFRNNVGSSITAAALITVQSGTGNTGTAQSTGNTGTAQGTGNTTTVQQSGGTLIIAQPSESTLTAYHADGTAETLTEAADGAWKTKSGILYYLGFDGVLRARGAEDLYTVKP